MGRGRGVVLFKGMRDRIECVRGEFQMLQYIERNKEDGRERSGRVASEGPENSRAHVHSHFLAPSWEEGKVGSHTS